VTVIQADCRPLPPYLPLLYSHNVFFALSQALSIGVPERRLGVQNHIQLNLEESGFLKTPLVAACRRRF
jgi:hypothetical protein